MSSVPRIAIGSTELGVIVVQRRVNYLGKGINRLERDGLKNGDPFKRVHSGSLMLDVLRMRCVPQLGQRCAALEPGQRRWRGLDYEPAMTKLSLPLTTPGCPRIDARRFQRNG
jgi:hypothetical protein